MTERYTYAYDGAGRLVMDSRNGDTDLVTRYGYNVRSAVTEIKAGGSNASTYGATFTELLHQQHCPSDTLTRTLRRMAILCQCLGVLGRKGPVCALR